MTTETEIEYAVINTIDMDGKWGDVLETEETSSKPCNDGSKRIIKWKGARPAWVATLGLIVYADAVSLYNSLTLSEWGEPE